ncbi:MAG: 4Fe-4S dicluster domain-containing protein [Desulfobacterales bacterium]|nr:4Fe-4S dicluster domain-containing protein [Desulfobacterales bacterium]
MWLRRTCQVLSLTTFLVLLGLAYLGSQWTGLLKIWLEMDPLVFLGTLLSGRVFLSAFIPALVTILASLVLGRFFCGWLCPMGATLDAGDVLLKTKHRKKHHRDMPDFKYMLLALIAGAALPGVSLVFLAAPLTLITRFYGLVIYPTLLLLAQLTTSLSQSVIEVVNPHILLAPGIRPMGFATTGFILGFFALLFGLGLLAPRFWCRYLCPSGAIFALVSGRPLLRRRVSDACTECGTCQRQCKMGAIDADGRATRHQECILCQTCKAVCPVDAIRYSPGKPKIANPVVPFSTGRREVLLAGTAGAGTALISLTGIDTPLEGRKIGRVVPDRLIRPPGALPEADLFSRCIRCGECMAACPTNTLQPLWFESGFIGIFSPSVVPGHGPCDPHCNRCAQVCPTEAIRVLEKNERLWAKTGTAVILPHKCIAWEHDKKCMVCDEVCPFDAVKFIKKKEKPVPVPVVRENMCSGCGYCEYHCPVKNDAAIIVTAFQEIRLAAGSYQKEGRFRGFDLALDRKQESGNGAEPGQFDELPPGFSLDPADK